VSICPPHAAEAVAAAVADAGFRGTFVDANAIAPERVVGIGRRLAGAGIEVVDGGVIGGPAWTPGTRLVLSGGGPRRWRPPSPRVRWRRRYWAPSWAPPPR
jgi:3-hydroxyisobutyrate dehydrogenase-like beta-hydroxyacid dehydrogenase